MWSCSVAQPVFTLCSLRLRVCCSSSISLVAPPAVSTLIKGSPTGRLPQDRELHPGFLPGTDGTLWGWRPQAGAGEENQRDAATLMCLSGERSPPASRPWPAHPNGGNFAAPRGNGLQMYSFHPSSLACLHRVCVIYEWSQAGVGGGRVYVGWGNLCVSFEACLIGFLCQGSLQGHTEYLLLEGIQYFFKPEAEFKHPTWKGSASQHNLWHSDSPSY